MGVFVPFVCWTRILVFFMCVYMWPLTPHANQTYSKSGRHCYSFISAFVVFYAIKTTYDCAASYASTYASTVYTLVNDGEIPEQFVCALDLFAVFLEFVAWIYAVELNHYENERDTEKTKRIPTARFVKLSCFLWIYKMIHGAVRMRHQIEIR